MKDWEKWHEEMKKNIAFDLTGDDDTIAMALCQNSLRAKLKGRSTIGADRIRIGTLYEIMKGPRK